MRRGLCTFIFLLLAAVSITSAQQAGTAGPAPVTNTNGDRSAHDRVTGTVPPVIKFSGTVTTEGSGPGVATLVFSIYEFQTGGSPLWSETQRVQLNAEGRYTVLLGNASATGLPLDLFVSGKALWLGVRPPGTEAVAPGRVLLAPVPYALKAADADTLGGKPASAFVTTDSQTGSGTQSAAGNTGTGGSGPNAAKLATSGAATSTGPLGTGTASFIPIWLDSVNLGNSLLHQSNNNIVLNGGISIQNSGANVLSVDNSGNLTAPTTGKWRIGPAYTDTGSPTLDPNPAKVVISTDVANDYSNSFGEDIIRFVSPYRAATSWRINSNGDMLGSTTFTVSGNTAGPVQFTQAGKPVSATQYMAGFTSDEWAVDPVMVISGNQGSPPPPGYTLFPKQNILLGVNGSDRSHTFSLLADGHMGIGLENSWQGSYQSGTIATERLTEQITVPNNAFLGGRNAADSSTDKLIGYNRSNQVSIAPGGQTTAVGGNVSVKGQINATSFVGDGSSLTFAGAPVSKATATNALNLGGLPPSAYQPAGAYMAGVTPGGGLVLTGNSVGLDESNSGYLKSSFLPLSGGTLTGRLTGTNAQFSGKVGISSNGTLPTYDVDVISSKNADTVVEVLNPNAGSAARANLRLGADAALFSVIAGSVANGQSVYFQAQNDKNLVFQQMANAPVLFFSNNLERMRIAGNGYIGIGTLAPAAALEVDSASGVIVNNTSASTANLVTGRNQRTNVFRVDSTGKGYFNAGTQTGGADFAESVAVHGSRSEYELGDLLAIDANADRHLALSQAPYSTLVAGIYSTKPGVLATPRAIDDNGIAAEIPLAVVGIVPCKVTAENGRIARGDLLVASSRPGYAMKGTDRQRMLGAVVGKALQPLDDGSGVIEVLVTLQ